MTAATTSQSTENLKKKLPFTSWLEPRSKDRDEAFRERSIRIAIALVVGFGLLSFILTVAVFKNKWDIISLPTLHVFAIGGFILAGYFISREFILAAAWSIVISLLVGVAGILILNRQEYANLVNGIPLTLIVVLVAALVLPRNSIWLVSIAAIAMYGIAMSVSQSPNSTEIPFNISQAIFTGSLSILIVSAILYRLRVEFDDRLTSVHRSIKQAEEARQQAEESRQRAEEADKAKSQFLANMSHELRTPLNAIIGYDEAMLGGMVGEFSAQQNKLLGHIQHNSRRLLGLINDILDLSKVESGSLQVFLAPISPNKVIRETVENLRSLADQKSIELNTTFSDDVPEVVLGDANKLQQVIVNVVSNAVKFTDKGSVTVAVDIVDSSNWRFQVKDTGIGMPSNASTYIFEPFQQVDGTDKRKYKGTGLGLAITKRLVERLGGSISVVSDIGKGSTFSIILPRAYVPADAPKPVNA
jgi:signal transduction histidine kinase